MSKKYPQSLQNVSENLKVGGHFIGTCFDGERVFEALKRRELEEEEWKQLIEYTKEKDLGFITAPYFPETVNFLSENNVDLFLILTASYYVVFRQKPKKNIFFYSATV